MNAFQIILGERWAKDRALVNELRATGSGGVRFDYSHVLDVMDIFIDGANVGAVASADSIACITRDLLVAIGQLVSGRALKTTVSFYERPFELVLQLAPSAAPALPAVGRTRGSGRSRRTDLGVLVTFFRSGPAPEVLVRNREVPLIEVARAATSAARRLATQIVRVNRSLATDAFVVDLRGLADEVAAAVRTPAVRIEAPPSATFESRDWDRGTSRTIPAIAFRAEADWSDLLGPVTPDRSDLASLLFRGDVAVWTAGRRRSIGRCYPFLIAERLLQVARHVLEAHDERRVPASLRLQSEDLLLGVRAEDSRLVVTFADRADVAEPVAAVFPDAGALAGAIVDVGLELRRAVLETAPAQRRNLRFEAFLSDLRQIHAWHRDLRSRAFVNRDPGSYRPEPAAEPDAPDPAEGERLVGEPRRMRYVERWHLEAEGLDLASTFLCGDRLVASAADTLLAVDRDSGEVIWRTGSGGTAASAAVGIPVGNRGLVRATSDGRVSMVDLSTGAEAWTTRMRPRVGRLSGTTVGAGRSPRLVVVSEGTSIARGLVALDTITGEPRWRFGARRAVDAEADSFEFVRAGRLLVVTCGDSSLYAVDGDTGEVVWRWSDRGRFTLRPAFDRDRLVAVSGEPGRPGATLHVFDAFTGRELAGRLLPGVPLGAPALSGTVALVATGASAGAGRPGITAVEASTGTPLWRRIVPGLDRGFAWLPVGDLVVVNVAGGHTLALHAPTGDVAWEQRLGADFSRDIPVRLDPVLRGGALFLPAAVVHVVRPLDGEVIHRLDEGPVPDRLRVDERCHLYVGEQSGHLAAFGLVARLALVK